MPLLPPFAVRGTAPKRHRWSIDAAPAIAQTAYDRLIAGEDIDYRVLDHLVDEASGKGVLQAMRQQYGPVGFEAIVMPVLQEIGRRKPIHSTRYTGQPGEDPLTAGITR